MEIKDIINKIDNKNVKINSKTHNLCRNFNLFLMAFWIEKFKSVIIDQERLNRFYNILMVKDFVNSAFLADHFNYTVQGKGSLRTAYEYLFKCLSEILNFALFKPNGNFRVCDTSHEWKKNCIDYYNHNIYYGFYEELCKPVHVPSACFINSDPDSIPFYNEHDHDNFNIILSKFINYSSDLLFICIQYLGLNNFNDLIPHKNMFSERIRKIIDMNYEQE